MEQEKVTEAVGNIKMRYQFSVGFPLLAYLSAVL